MNLLELEMQWKKNATVRSRASGTDLWAITRYGSDDWLPCSIAILSMITTLLCCYVGDCSTLQGLVMALFIDWPERDGSFVFYIITSKHITSDWAKYNSGEVQAVRDTTIQSSDFPTVPINLKIYIFVILHPIQATEPPDVMYGWCPKCRDKYSTEYAQLCGLVLPYICLHDCARWLVLKRDSMTKECYR